jgi:hypothetical protein
VPKIEYQLAMCEKDARIRINALITCGSVSDYSADKPALLAMIVSTFQVPRQNIFLEKKSRTS